MQKLYVIGGAAVVAALVLGTLAATLVQHGTDEFADCRSTTVAGGQIGGPFTLLDGDGKTVTDRDLLAKPALIYFGYSFCPDECPLDNARNAQAADDLAKAGHDVTPVFISVDPTRDTPAIMKEYAANISPRMVGLTGSPEQVKAAAAAYKVFFNIPVSSDPNYSVDHTTLTYLMLPGRGFMDVFDRSVSEEDLVKHTSCYLDKAKS
jgi:protein SCO1/2